MMSLFGQAFLSWGQAFPQYTEAAVSLQGGSILMQKSVLNY